MHGEAQVQGRLSEMLHTSLGPCGALLAEPRLVELMANADGRVWAEWAGDPRCMDTGYVLPVHQRETVIRVLAGRMELVCHAESPRLSTILPETGERFQGMVPPIVEAPVFSIRKPASRVFTLAEYVGQGVMTGDQAAGLATVVRQRRNVLIGGATGSGKTTCANAVLAVMADAGERMVLLEDTPELQCAAPNTVRLVTRPGLVTMQQLVQDTLRLRPDRIVLGEVRGVEAVDLLDAWATGHPGGLCTVHAGSAAGVLSRLEQLMRRGNIPQEVAREMLGAAQPVIAYVERTGTGRLLKELVSVEGWRQQSYQLCAL